MNAIELTTIISFALLGSVGHCIGMCGGFVLTYTTAKINPNMSKRQQSIYHGLYNIGRVVSYMILGAVFGYFGSLWDISPLARALMFGFAGVLMILMGISFAGGSKFLTSLEYPIAQQGWFKRIFSAQLRTPTAKSFFVLGMLNGLVPCGLVYTMLVTATTTQSALWGAAVMGIFGIFTIPTLFSLAFVVGLFSQNRFRQTMIQFAALTIILFGGWTLMKAYMQFDYYLNTSVEKKVKDGAVNMKCGSDMKCAAGKCGMGKCGGE